MGPAAADRCPPARPATGRFPAPAACNHSRTAGVPIGKTHLVRIVHPFHPLSGQQLPRIGACANVAGRRVLCLDENKVVWTVAIEWTDLVEPTPEQEINAGRAYVLVDELLALATLIARRNA